MRVLSIGEVLWDVFADSEFLGGAALNVCANLQRCGDEAILVSAVGEDARGYAALETMNALGLSTLFVQTIGDRPTGTATVTKDSKGEPVFTIHRPAAFDAIKLSGKTAKDIRALRPDWLYMGTLLQTEPAMEKLIHTLLEDLDDVRCFYDMNLRSGHWDLSLVERLCKLASVLKLNEIEAETLATLSGISREEYSLEFFCSVWAQRFGIDMICVTLGAEGCCIYSGEKAERFSGYPIRVSDTVGAGDAFAAAFLHGYHWGWPTEKCAGFANALGALVASRPGATPVWRMDECHALSAPSEITRRAPREPDYD
jgi:fructokinase